MTEWASSSLIRGHVANTAWVLAGDLITAGLDLVGRSRALEAGLQGAPAGATRDCLFGLLCPSAK